MLKNARYDLTKVFRGPFRTYLLALIVGGAMCAAVAPLLGHNAASSLASLVIAGYLVGSIVLLAGMLSRIAARLNDVHASVSLFANVERGSEQLWVDGAAANAQLQWFVWKALSACKPTSVAEFGSGQTSKLFARYFEENPGVRVCTFEHDKTWMELLRPQLARNGHAHEYVYAPLEARTFVAAGTNVKVSTKAYRLPDDFDSQRFQLVLVDGPDTGPQTDYTREGVLEHLPAILADDFVLIFDDAERPDERRLVNLCDKVLRASGRKFVRFEIEGGKTQVVFCSQRWSFLRSI